MTTTAFTKDGVALSAARFAVHAVELSRELPEWVHLIPAGTFTGRDGRGPYTLADAAGVIAATDQYRGGQPLPIDFGHALEAEVGGPERFGAPAAGWLTAFEARDDGIWGQVEWSDDGAASVRGRAYRFLSPVFAYAANGQVLALLRAGLTNLPNLADLTAINSAGASAGGDHAMSDKLKAFLAAMAVMVGLAETSDEATVQTAVQAKLDSEKTNREALEQLRTTLKLESNAEPAAVLVAAQAQLTATAPDPSQYVPIAMHTQVAQRLHELQKKDGARAVDEAIEAGKLTPPQRDWALAYHAQNPQGFAEFVSKQPVIGGEGAERKGPPPSATTAIDEAGKAVCATLGIPEADYMKTLSSR